MAIVVLVDEVAEPLDLGGHETQDVELVDTVNDLSPDEGLQSSVDPFMETEEASPTLIEEGYYIRVDLGDYKVVHTELLTESLHGEVVHNRPINVLVVTSG
jgi:hypothetical protein